MGENGQLLISWERGEKILHITNIDTERNYWLVRTEGGTLYEEFVGENFIAVGWNEISDLKQIKASAEDEKIKDDIIDKIKEIEYEDGKKEQQPTRVYNQIDRFVNLMKPGDIVLIPSKNSLLIEFGVITSDVFIEDVDQNKLDEGLCTYLKRRKVDWILRENRYKLDPYLFQLLNSHHAVSSANDYAHYIDRMLHSLFIKGDQAHLIIRVEKKEKIYANELLQLINAHLELIDFFNEATGSNYSKNDVQLKINVQSPGPVELFGSIEKVMIISVALSALLGGKSSILGVKVEFPEGLADKTMKFIDWLDKRKKDKEIKQLKEDFEEKLKALEAKIPHEIKSSHEEQDEQDNN